MSQLNDSVIQMNIAMWKLKRNRDLEESGVLGMLLGDATAQHSWGLGNIPQGLRDQDDSRDGRLRRASRAGFPIGLASSEPLAAAVGVTGVCAGYTVRFWPYFLGIIARGGGERAEKGERYGGVLLFAGGCGGGQVSYLLHIVAV